MKRYDQIHETVVKDIIDIFDEIKDAVEDGDLDNFINGVKKNRNRSFSSIAKASDDLTLVFPVASSKNISIDTQSMISKAIERKCVTMLQILFSAMQVSDQPTAQKYIGQFHTNLSKSAKLIGVDDIIRLSDKLDESAINSVRTGDVVNSAIIKEVMDDMKNINYVLPSNVNERPISEAISKGKFKSSKDDDDSIKFPNAKDKKDISDYFKNQVISSDIKKANELVPTIMTFGFTYSDENGRKTPINNVIIGIKAKLYPIASEDIVSHVVNKSQDSNWLTNFIRASTREISFFKDFLFAVDRAKIDALSMSRRGSSSKMWKVLERRALKSKWNRMMAKSNDTSAITTLVISQNEVDYIKKNYNIDVISSTVAHNLLENYNLMGICIVDESLEVAKFMFDTGDDEWENIAFSMLEREASDNTYKKVVNLMTKVM